MRISDWSSDVCSSDLLDSSWMNMSVSAFRADDLEQASRYGGYSVVAGPALAGAPFNLAGVRRHQGRGDEARGPAGTGSGRERVWSVRGITVDYVTVNIIIDTCNEYIIDKRHR